MITEVDNELFREQKKQQSRPAPLNMFTVELEGEDIDQQLGTNIRLHATYVNTPEFTPEFNNNLTCSPTTLVKFTEYEDYKVYAYFLAKVTEEFKNKETPENIKKFTIKVTACNKDGIPVIQWTYPNSTILSLSGLEYMKDNVGAVKFQATFKGERCDVELLRAWHKSI